jgi:hypothetical protein
MTFLAYALLFFFSGFAGHLANADRGNAFGLFLTVALPVAGVYFLGWWALLAFFVGLAFGGRVFWELERRLTRTGHALPHPTRS